MTPGTGPDSARRALLFIVALALGGCGLTRPAPVKETYLLEPPLPPAVAKPQPTSVRVGAVNVAAPFRGRGLVYRASELRYETDYYQEFLIPPSTMLTELTSRALERSKAFARVVPPGSAGSADWELNGFVSALYVDVSDNARRAAEIAISFYLFAGDRIHEMPVWTRDYRRHAPVSAQTSQAYAAALNAALGEIFTELTRDLAAAELAKRN
jgi:cholesterol transport system auxiliary component